MEHNWNCSGKRNKPLRKKGKLQDGYKTEDGLRKNLGRQLEANHYKIKEIQNLHQEGKKARQTQTTGEYNKQIGEVTNIFWGIIKWGQMHGTSNEQEVSEMIKQLNHRGRGINNSRMINIYHYLSNF